MARSAPRRVRVGDNEVDYVTEDVTVRHFTRTPEMQKAPLGGEQVDYVSEDVTVHRFAPPVAVAPPKKPVDHGAVSTSR